MRSLATIQRIKSLEPIPGKDKIVYASFCGVGWHVIVGTDMKVGDLCVYVEYDSVLPLKPEFEFLRSRCWSPRYNGFRIRGMRMANLLSEGIAFPLSILPVQGVKYEEGQDVTDLLGIVKYDPELLEENKEKDSRLSTGILRFLFRIPLLKKLFFRKKNKGWPKWASKSDETRVQNLTYVFDKYQGLDVVLTEKMDGCSALYGLHKGKFYVCSRNLQIQKAKGKYAKEQSRYLQAAQILEIEKKLKKAKKLYGYDFYIQGELCGPTIQGNKYEFEGLRLFVFNVYSITQKKYLAPFELQNFCHEIGLETVPFLGRTRFAWANVDEIVARANGPSMYGNTPREGIVVRSERWMPPDLNMALQWSLKVISPEFMVKYGL